MTASVPEIVKIHSAWRDGRFLIWGEGETHKVAARHLPFAVSHARTAKAIAQVADHNRLPAAAQLWKIWLPTGDGMAVPSLGVIHGDSQIRPWTVPVNVLSVESALRFLDASNQNPAAESWDTKLAPSTSFWGSALRFAADLALRDRYLPSLAREGDQLLARWRPLLGAPDQARLRQLARAMPPVARAMTLPDAATAPDDDPVFLLTGFVAWMIDHLPRRVSSLPRYQISPPPAAGKAANARTSPDAAWMSALCSMEPEMRGDAEALSAFYDRVEEWQRPIIHAAEVPWLLAFELKEPEESPQSHHAEPALWHVRYYFEPAHGGAPISLAQAPARYAARLLGRAATICPDVRPDTDAFPLDSTGAFRFLSETSNALVQQGHRVVLPEWWNGRELAPIVSARAIVKPAGRSVPGGSTSMFSLSDLMRFDWEVAIGGENYTHEELERMAASTAQLVQVHGKWVTLDPAGIRAALELWKREPVSAGEAIRMALGAAPDPPGVRLERARGEGWIGELLSKLGGYSRYEELAPPVGFQGTLRPYQLRGFSWLGFLRQYGLGACLADDMGLGKTIQALALLERERVSGVERPVLLICPTSVVGNWRKEAERFAPELSVLVHHGQSRTRGDEFAELVARKALVISTYALVYRDLEMLQEIGWSGIILDEAQNIKNPDTHQARAVCALKADYRIALTGTPVENNVGDLWSLMDFLNPGFLGNQAEFRRQFLIPIQKDARSEAAEHLRTLTAPFILRRLKTDNTVIQDLPEKMEMKVFCNLTPEQAALYKGVVEDAGRALDGSVGIQRKGVILATLTKLKQVCNHPAQFLRETAPLAGRSGKLSRLTEMVEELLAEGDRALIFSQFTEMGDRLQRHLSETLGQEVLFLHGGVPAAKRDVMVERFQNGGAEDPRLFVLSLKAGGTGLNLTAANHVFHFDRWWNPAVENQATDRAFRIGQKRNVQIHKFVCIGTVEERIDEMIERKKEVADKVVGTGEAWLTELSTDEIKQLFALRQEAVS